MHDRTTSGGGPFRRAGAGRRGRLAAVGRGRTALRRRGFATAMAALGAAACLAAFPAGATTPDPIRAPAAVPDSVRGRTTEEPRFLPAGAAAASPTAPVLDREFADPDVVEVDGVFHAYATNVAGRHVQHATSTDLVHWTVDEKDVLPVPGDWVKPDPPRDVWAPEVFDNGDGFTLQYTARDRVGGRQCIGAALASSPDGPFRPAGDAALVCPTEAGGAIDASSYTENGTRHLLWKSDGNCCGLDTWLHIQPVSWDGTRVTGEPVRLLRQDRAWEGGLVEAPTLVKRDGRYVLLYSAGDYRTTGYATGWAIADALTGPYVKGDEPLLTTDSFSGTIGGPGGQDVVTGPGGRDRILFHGRGADPSRRALYVADLGFADGRPVVRGSKTLHQAELARVHRATIREAKDAWGGRAVGHIDEPDSFVEFRVYAASSGPHTLTVRYGNGSLDAAGAPAAATHGLTVNGAAVGVVEYPYTGWDAWQPREVPVELREGWNTLRLSKGERYTELDAVQVA
ncbi:family 43 glycosylhydrolase [Streptomyces sp. CB02009]|uniref:family 43 glycosylhydrolase n=1 Tax=Streptomyces sp. CB02009 TaxID=1703938 RepID=UPI000A7908E3|nr:family 43 glycosylhydrolase [Streptomyces sp. CB02009]